MSDFLAAVAAENSESWYATPEPRFPGALVQEAARAVKAIQAAAAARSHPIPEPQPAATPTAQERDPMSTPVRIPQTLSELYPRKFLTAADLAKPYPVTIKAAEVIEVYDEMKREKVQKLAVSMYVTDANGHQREASKRLLVNKTQAEALAKLSGSERFADWRGLAVILSPATAHNGKATITILPAPKAEPAPAEPAAAPTPAT